MQIYNEINLKKMFRKKINVNILIIKRINVYFLNIIWKIKYLFKILIIYKNNLLN